MSALVLIRHGQASFGAPDYDVLSERGIRQSRCLGAHLAAARTPVDAIYCGPRRRHTGTAEHLRQAAADAGLETPEPIIVDDLDELPAFELVAHWRPIIEAREPALAREILAGSTRAMAAILDRWGSGELDSGEHESYAAFEGRVRGAIDRIRAEQGSGKNVAVITSGGTVAVSVGYSLDLPPQKTLALIWSIANSSTTELRYRPGALGLTAFNRVGHISEAELLTTR